MKILSFNALGSFGDPSRHVDAVEFVESVSPDVAFFPEGYRVANNPHIVESSVHRLGHLGYRVFHGRTELLDDRVDQTGFFAIVQPEVGNGRIVQTGIRQGFLALLTETESGQPIRLVGTHLDDRSEQLRLEQALQLPKADVVMGDLNAMHGEDPVAKALRLLQPLTDRLTDRFDISPELATRPHDRIATLAKRLARMGHGTTLRVLQESFDLYDADITHEPTIRGIAQLDHILTKPHITTSDYTVHHDVKLSDHKPISATIDR